MHECQFHHVGVIFYILTYNSYAVNFDVHTKISFDTQLTLIYYEKAAYHRRPVYFFR